MGLEEVFVAAINNVVNQRLEPLLGELKEINKRLEAISTSGENEALDAAIEEVAQEEVPPKDETTIEEDGVDDIDDIFGDEDETPDESWPDDPTTQLGLIKQELSLYSGHYGHKKKAKGQKEPGMKLAYRLIGRFSPASEMEPGAKTSLKNVPEEQYWNLYSALVNRTLYSDVEQL